MKRKLEILINNVESFSARSIEEVEQFKLQYLSKKGIIPSLFKDFKTVPADAKKDIGKEINLLKNLVQEKVFSLQKQFSIANKNAKILDLDLPGDAFIAGSRHPISLVRTEIIDVFSHLGFVVSEGPEIEDDEHVFSRLNFPPEHPARDMQDTFFIQKSASQNTHEEDILLRTHTSSVQVRVMDQQKPPIRTISPGRVFRNEAISARAHCIFHQIEGLYVDKNVSFADLKQTLLFFAREIFGNKTQIRLRPSFFPFTEPSAEMDVSCRICSGKGCNVCKNTGWLEILGCGMVDPNVLQASHIDSDIYTGFAFGMGIERIAMLKYNINDLRLFFENDIRFLEQFASAF